MAPREATLTEVDRLLDGFEDLPTIPEVLVRIWRIVDDPDSSASDLEQVVSLEAPLAARLLRLANSPYYGARASIQNVQSAIRQLGFATVRNLAVCLSVASGLAARQKSGDGLDRRVLWRHSVATAVLSRSLARETDLISPEDLFTAGLLHDLGKFVIALGAPGGYAEILRRVRDEGIAPREAERRCLGADHAEIGAAFARRWGFPPELAATIGGHHASGQGDPAALVGLADGLAHELTDGEDGLHSAPQLAEEAQLAAFGLDRAWLEERRAVFVQEIAAAQDFMNLL